MMGWNGFDDTTDFATDAIDNGTMGDTPQGEGPFVMDYGGMAGIGSQVANIAGGYTQTGAMGGAAMAVGAGALAMGARIAPAVFNAIVKISARLGGASGSVLGYGRKVWASLSSWAARNPGVSLMSTLVGLGLTVEEAAHFIAWGATSKRRRRTRGITGRDVKTTRRTMRKLQHLNHLIASACSSTGFRRARRHK